MKRIALLAMLLVGTIALSPGSTIGQGSTSLAPSDRPKPTAAALQPGSQITFDFQDETVGGQPKSFVPIVGNFSIAAEGDNKVLVIDGRNWKQGQTAAGVAEHAKS